MSRRSKLTDEERIQAVQEYLDGKGSYMTIAKRYGISAIKLQDMVCLAKEKGIDFIRSKERNQSYTAEIKIMAVEAYLSEKGSQYTICAKYGIKSRSILQRWILCYSSGKDFQKHTRSESGH